MVEYVIKVVKFSLRYLETVWFYARRIAKKMMEEDVLLLASGLAFNGLLTMIPLLLLAASALGVVLNSSRAALGHVNSILDAVFPPQPFATSIKESILSVIADIIAYRRSIGLFGAVFLVWTATSLFDALRSVLHRIYHLKRTRNIFVTIVHDVVFVFLGFGLLVASNVFLWTFSFVERIARSVPGLEQFRGFTTSHSIPTVLVVLLTGVMFYIVYRYIPDTKPPKLAGIISTISSTLLWVVSGKVFGWYLSGFSSIDKIYGPYAFLLVLLFWIYYSSIVFIIGGIVGQTYWERHKLKESGKLQRWVVVDV
ncbi:MAG: hypothetical protein C4326_02830 [Ignavibacteria bacterium]